VFDITPRHQVQFLSIAGRSLLELNRANPDPNLITRGVMTTGFTSATWRAIIGRSTLTQRLGYSGSSFDNAGQGTDLASGRGGEWSYRADAAVAADRWTAQGGVYARRRRVDERFFRAVGFVGGARTPRTEVINGAETEVIGHARAGVQAGAFRLEAGAAVYAPVGTTGAPWAPAGAPRGTFAVRVGAAGVQGGG